MERAISKRSSLQLGSRTESPMGFRGNVFKVIKQLIVVLKKLYYWPKKLC